MRLHYNRRQLLTPRFRKPSALAAARVAPDFTTDQDGLPKVAMEPESNWRKLLTWARLKKGLALSATVAVPVVALTAPTVQMEQTQQAPGQTSDEPLKHTHDAITGQGAPLHVSIENLSGTEEASSLLGPISFPPYSIRFGLVTPDMPYSVKDYPGSVSLEPGPADELIRVLGPNFPEENTPEKHAESRQALHESIEELKKGAGEIGKDWVKDRVKEYGTDVVLVVAGSLVERGKKSGSKLIQWVGEAIIKICHRPETQPESSNITASDAPATTGSAAPNITASQAAEKCDCSVAQAEALLKYLGYRKIEVWLPPSSER